MKIKKAVIPVEGFGTWVLPATKAKPNEMLLVVDKPAVQYVVGKTVQSGAENALFVAGCVKRAIGRSRCYCKFTGRILNGEKPIFMEMVIKREIVYMWKML